MISKMNVDVPSLFTVATSEAFQALTFFRAGQSCTEFLEFHEAEQN